MQKKDQNQQTTKVKPSYIIIEGAQSTGKTTLINQLKQVYPCTLIITEVARTVIRELNISNEDLQSNKDNCFLDLQNHIFIAQHKKESQIRLIKDQQKFIKASNHNFCFLDRCVLSPLVYSIHYFGKNQDLIDKIQKSQKFHQSIKSYKKEGLVILLHPHQLILKDDGVRKKATFIELQKITEIYKGILDKYELNYCEIYSLEDRIEFVNKMLQNFSHNSKILNND